jgi:hypothetical protein
MNAKLHCRNALAATVALATLAPHLAAAKDITPQNNEVATDITASFANTGDNDSDVSIVYTWYPEALDKNDEVVPLLRRYVRQPTEIGGKATINNDITDTIYGLHAFGQGWLGGLGYGRGEAGLEYDAVINDPDDIEHAFLAANLRAEAGVRLFGLLQLGGFYRYRPVLITFPNPLGSLAITQERSGNTQEFGGSLAFATPEDRLYLQGMLGYRNIDWDFTGQYAGPITGKALIGQAKVSLQLSPRFSLYLSGEFSNTDWDNERLGQTGPPPSVTGRPPKGTRIDVRGDAGFTYWFEGKWGFRIALGGGYYDKGPVRYQNYSSGLLRLGVGFTTRY